MTQETNQPDDTYRVSIEAVMEQYQKMHTQSVYDLALANAGVEQLVTQVRDKEVTIQHFHETETRMTNEIEGLTSKLHEAERLMREQGQIIERYRMVYGNPPELVMSDREDDDRPTDGQDECAEVSPVSDEVFQGKAVRRKR